MMKRLFKLILIFGAVLYGAEDAPLCIQSLTTLIVPTADAIRLEGTWMGSLKHHPAMPHANWGNVELYAYRGEHYLVVELFKEGPFNQFDDRAITDTIVYGGVKNEIVTGKTRAGQEEGKVGVIYKDDASCLICYGFENHHHCFTTQARATLKSTEGKILARRVFDYQESENGPLKQWRSKHPGAREGNLIDLMRVYRQVIKEELWGEIQD